jgi:tetratricopeptide (TPR) repeat protein
VPSERVQRQIDQHLDAAEEASLRLEWAVVRDHAHAVLDLDSGNGDATALLASAENALARGNTGAGPTATTQEPSAKPPTTTPPAQPTSFANGRYTVTKFLGEGGKKKVYLARDSRLDRDVAFALIKTEGLDEASRVRVQREAEAMGRLGAHPHIVTVFDIGEEDGQPYLVLPVLGGGDVEGVIEKAPENKLTIERAVKIALDTCLGLEFAHSKGIVHRDLKPGNVWLTEDGRAMIGDFGLAVAVDKSRLTRAGMMVGTVSYMPPEQAMGGEVGPRSDLYSLGAMLYEMVCGRPPFVGDESVAIIGQHLNTPPVAPSWHRPECPTSLEALILRLLEKDPSKRPASATEVREALESVTTSATQRQPSVAKGVLSGDNPLYRRTFVGRESELKQGQAAFDAALSGQGGLVMVVGEPGIGKTALCEQLATYVALRGGKALVGHCYEEGSLSLPYLAFVEAMRSYVLAREPDGLRSDLGTGAADVARIVSEVRDRVQGVELRPAGDPEDDRWRLLQAVTSFLRNASSVQPLCIVLEDLHWADRGTLDLLLHVSRNLQGARLLVVGTYRDVEVDRTHPLSATLGELRRVGTFARIPLRGLTVDEVHRMYEAIRGQATPWGQAEAVHRQTEGNPLFVQEVLRYLVEEGIVVREGGRYVAQGGEGVGIPEGLRDVVGRRLSRLSEKANQVLAIAAVMGREFRLDVLEIVAGIPEDELYGALAEAVERAVVEERSGVGAAVAYRFAHAFFRQTLYEETIAPRRIRLHQQVARALENVYGRRLEEHAAELAEHYSYSSSPEDLKKAVEYGELAAKRATSVFDYGEAERHLQQALKVQEVFDPDDKLKRCDLLLALGEAMLPQENPIRISEVVAADAFSLATSIADHPRAARSAIQAVQALRAAGLITEPVFDEWAQRADEHARNGTVERIYADMAMAGVEQRRRGPAGLHLYLRRAVATGRALGDNRAFFAATAAGFGLRALQDRALREDLAREVMSHPREGASSVDLGLSLIGAGRILLETGDRLAAEAAWREFVQLAGGSHDIGLAVAAQAPEVFIAFLDGRLEAAVAGLEAMLQLSLETGVGGTLVGVNSGDAYGLTLARLYHYLGSPAALLERFIRTGGARVERVNRGLINAFLGRTHESVSESGFGDIGSDDDETGTQFLVNIFETSILVRDFTMTAALARRLSPVADHLSEGRLNCVDVSIGRLCGEAAMLLGRPDGARGFYAQALEVCERVGFRPEVALIRLDLAELLLEHYPVEHDAAIEHLDFAIAELRDMKMQPALERALRHRGLLKA